MRPLPNGRFYRFLARGDPNHLLYKSWDDPPSSGQIHLKKSLKLRGENLLSTADVSKLGGGFRYFFYFFYFHPYLGKIPILTNIFQLGWNHQLENCGEHLWSLAVDKSS